MTKTVTTIKYRIGSSIGVVGRNPFQKKSKIDSLQNWKLIDKLNKLKEYRFTVPNDEFTRANVVLERKLFIPFISPFRGVVIGKSINDSSINVTSKEFATHLERREFTNDGFKRITYTNENWYDSDWKYRKKITIDKTISSRDYYRIPIPIILEDEGLKNRAKLDASDIRFTKTDGITLLSHKLDYYDNGKIYAWVKLSKISENSNTEIYMYYGNPDATNLSVTDVFSNILASTQDSPGINYELIEGFENISSSLIGDYGMIGKSIRFSGTNRYTLSDSDISNLFLTTFNIISFYTKIDSGNTNSKGYLLYHPGWSLYTENESDGFVDLVLESSFSTTNGKWKIKVPVDEKIFIDLKYRRTHIPYVPEISINGEKKTITKLATPSGTYVTNTSDSIYIGNNSLSNSGFKGDVDEIRIEIKSDPNDKFIDFTKVNVKAVVGGFIAFHPQEQYARPANEICQQILDSANSNMHDVVWKLGEDFPTKVITGTFNFKNHYDSLNEVALILGKDLFFDNESYKVYIETKGKTLKNPINIIITSNPETNIENFANIINIVGKENNNGTQLEKTVKSETVLRYDYEKTVSDNQLGTNDELENIGNNLLDEFQKLTPQIKGQIPTHEFNRLNLQSGDIVKISQPKKQISGSFRVMDIVVDPQKAKISLESTETGIIRLRSNSLEDVIEGMLKKIKDSNIMS